jgi:hypothetical protein
MDGTTNDNDLTSSIFAASLCSVAEPRANPAQLTGTERIERCVDLWNTASLSEHGA